MKALLGLLAVAAWGAETDICIYGGTAAGVTAAIQAARMGKTVALVEPGRHFGGMSVEGLGSSDINNHPFRNDVAIGGLAREFYERVGKKYGKSGSQYVFESHIAEEVINEWLRRDGISLYPGHRLTRVVKFGTRVVSMQMENGVEFRAKVFLDATIEGDLLAAAGVTTFIGREGNARYGETKNGIRKENTYRNFEVRVDPYKVPGDARSGLIPTIQDEPFGEEGAADHRIQGYCFRLCLTREAGNRIAITKPEGFDRGLYEIYFRYMKAGGKLFAPSARLPGGKTDLGSWHDLSLNLYGMNHEYPGGSYAVRERIIEEHRKFAQGLMWLLANDKEVPEETRAAWRDWGLCKDEFTDNGGWPRQLYVREARRMVSDYAITEHHTRRVNPEPVADPVAVSFWPPDTHHVRRIVVNGAAYNEGFVFGGEEWGPFGVSYRAMVPRRREAENLMTPTCVSSTHVAYGAVRIEWTFLALGQAAGTAAVMALEGKQAVQDVDYRQLRARLLKDGQVLGVNLVPRK